MDKIKLEKCGDNEWIFVESEQQRKHMEKLYQAEELMEIGEFDEAQVILKNIIVDVPEFIEAYNDIFLCYLYRDQDQEAFRWLSEALSNILAHLPEEFLLSKEAKLYWPFLENRPFLRVYCNMANEYLAYSDFKIAQQMFENILMWNPDDNQGVRELLVTCYFELRLYDKILTLCDSYKDDILPGLLYARPLVHFMRGEDKLAKKALLTAIERVPRVAYELIKARHVKPKSMEPGLITLGGKDEAYQYWLDFGKFWKKTDGAIAFVKKTLNVRLN